MGNCKKTCACGTNRNFGVKATAEFKSVRKIIFMDYQDDAGLVNSLDLTATMDKAFWDALKIETTDKRIQITPTIEDYAPTTGDATTVERASGKVVKVRDGIVSYEWFIDDADGTMYNALKSRECKDNGIFLIDDCGSIAGKGCEADKLSVAQIAPDTMDVQFIPGTDADIQRVRVRFNLDLSESPVFNIIPDSEIEYSPLNLRSICDGELSGTPSVSTQTQLVGVLEASNSFSKKLILAEGLDTAALWTITDSAGATSNPTLVTEAPAGTYTFDYAIIATGEASFYYIDANFEVTFTSTIV
jgi:hypothetical protein